MWAEIVTSMVTKPTLRTREHHCLIALMFPVGQPNVTSIFISGYNKLLPLLQESIDKHIAVLWTSDFSDAFD